MRLKYPIQVDPATIVLQLCLCANPKCGVTSDDVVDEMLAVRGKGVEILQTCYRVESIKGIKLGVIIDEEHHEIDMKEFVLAWGRNVAMEALCKARESTLRLAAMAQKIDLSDDT